MKKSSPPTENLLVPSETARHKNTGKQNIIDSVSKLEIHEKPRDNKTVTKTSDYADGCCIAVRRLLISRGYVY